MINRNVLFIAYYFPPLGLSGVQRTLKFVKYLPDYNWTPHVLTDTPKSFYAYDESMLNELDGKSVEIYRTLPKKGGAVSTDMGKIVKFPSYFKQKLGRAFLQTFYQPDRFIKWKKQAVRLGEEIISSHDIHTIYATAPPFTDFLVAFELSQITKIPFIVDYRDVWLDNPFHFYATPYHKMNAANLEKKILTYAEKIIVTTRHTKELLLKRYKFISHDDISIIPHGWDPEDFDLCRGTKPNPNRFTITHSGVFQDNRTPYYFLKALSNCVKNSSALRANVEARFIGILRQRHIKLFKKLGLQDVVKNYGYCSHVETVKHLLESDVLWLWMLDTIRSPGKLYEYFGARKPLIVSAPDGIIRRTALETKVAIATEPKDVKAIEKAIMTFFEMWQSRSLPQISEEYSNLYNRKTLTGLLAKDLALASEV